MDINDLVLTDEALGVIDSGAWVGDLLEAPGLELKVCGLRSKDARRALEQKQAQARAKNRGKPLSDEQLAVCMRETLAEVVLKDWRGLSSGGEPVEYSREQAAKWLTSRNGERFAALVLQAAQQIDDQANSFVEAATKKLIARLQWSLDNPNADQIIRDYSRFGQEIPDSLIPPELHDIEWSYWEAFWELSTARQVGMVAGPIPWTAVQAYAQANPGMGADRLSCIVRAMDNAYLSHKGGESKTFTRDMLRAIK